MGLWSSGDGDGFAPFAQSLAEDADDDRFSRWIGGVIFVLLVAVLAFVHFAAAAGWPRLDWLFKVWHIHDHSVMGGLGFFILVVSMFMHFHYFWTPSTRWRAVGQIGKSAAALILVGLLLFAAFGGLADWFEVPRLWRGRRW